MQPFLPSAGEADSRGEGGPKRPIISSISRVAGKGILGASLRFLSKAPSACSKGPSAPIRNRPLRQATMAVVDQRLITTNGLAFFKERGAPERGYLGDLSA